LRRKVIGKVYNIRVEVLLIYDDTLYTLDGREILFDSLKRSKIWIDKQYLGKCDIKE